MEANDTPGLAMCTNHCDYILAVNPRSALIITGATRERWATLLTAHAHDYPDKGAKVVRMRSLTTGRQGIFASAQMLMHMSRDAAAKKLQTQRG